MLPFIKRVPFCLLRGYSGTSIRFLLVAVVEVYAEPVKKRPKVYKK